jgi:hypothetical protein
MAETSNPLSDGVVIETVTAVGWLPRATADGAAGAGNEHLLRLLLFSDEWRPEGDEEKEYATELLRIEAKLDLVLELLATLQPEERSLEICHASFSAAGVHWRPEAGEVPETGAPVWILLRPDQRLPRPLQLPAVVTEKKWKEGAWKVSAAFEMLDEPLQALWERYIFRQHRRQVAQLRRRSQDGQGSS